MGFENSAQPTGLHVDPEVADLRVSGLFSLDDTDRTLQALQATLPVRVNTRTRYWALLETSSGGGIALYKSTT